MYSKITEGRNPLFIRSFLPTRITMARRHLDYESQSLIHQVLPSNANIYKDEGYQFDLSQSLIHQVIPSNLSGIYGLIPNL